jgi:hypothetical protein
MDKISKQELETVVRQRGTKAIAKKSPELSSESALMLSGMLHLAAAQSKYDLTESEIQFWGRQVAGYPPNLIEEFFTQHLAESQWMPNFHDWHEWAEVRVQRSNYELAQADYEDSSRRQSEIVRVWHESPEYESDMRQFREMLEGIVGRIAAKRPAVVSEIPLAFSPEKEREILAEYTKGRIQ